VRGGEFFLLASDGERTDCGGLGPRWLIVHSPGMGIAGMHTLGRPNSLPFKSSAEHHEEAEAVPASEIAHILRR
jgi:hypothetical protein